MLDNKVAVVTGGRSGIGRAIAIAYAAAGAKVVIADLHDASEAAREIEELGTRGLALHCDVSSEDSVRQLFESVTEEFGGVDVLVNNAGLFPFSTVETMPLAMWEQVFATNGRGMFLCARSAIPIMRRRGGGKIINIGSSTFFQGLAQSAAYVATKGAVVGFTRALARELGPENIQVNTLTLGLTRTEGVVSAGVTDEFFGHFASLQCIPRTQTPADLVGAALFLASAHSNFMTGQILNVDGGLNTH